MCILLFYFVSVKVDYRQWQAMTGKFSTIGKFKQVKSAFPFDLLWFTLIFNFCRKIILKFFLHYIIIGEDWHRACICTEHANEDWGLAQSLHMHRACQYVTFQSLCLPFKKWTLCVQKMNASILTYKQKVRLQGVNWRKRLELFGFLGGRPALKSSEACV